MSANTKCLNQGLCWGGGLTLCRPQASIGRPAHPAHSVRAFSPFSFFTPPRLPAPQHVLAHKQHGWWVGPRLRTGPDSQFELITDGLHALLTTRRARGRQPPHREGSLLHQTHSYPITKNDRPGTPPGISGGFLMQHSGRIFVPGFALS